jgi:hypothetical protein
MENNLHNRDFEHFLKQNANQYRMYPSERVWKGIYSSLHTRRRWLWFGLSLLGLSIASVTWIMLTTPASRTQASLSPENTINYTEQVYDKTVTPVAAKKAAPSLDYSENTASEIPFLINYSTTDKPDIIVSGAPEVLTMTEAVQEEDIILSNKKVITEASSLTEKTELPVPGAITSLFITDQATDNYPDYISNPSDHKNISLTTAKISQDDNYPLSIESVLNDYKASVKKKITLQAYVVPTVSYRKLSENKAVMNAAAATNSSLNLTVVSDINSVVTHKPDIGLELGLTAKYPLMKNLKLRGGLQFNISKYDIKAFNYNGEVTTIALNQGSQVDAIYTWSNYRNYSGFSPDWLKNYYFSVSAPIGAEFKIAGNKKASYGVAGTIQPTYVIQDRAFLISSDYKNYAQIPWLIRRWNANTSLETFVSYHSGKIKWQIGPQVRYQLFSSFSSKYPVKENLFDVGLKVGVSLKD